MNKRLTTQQQQADTQEANDNALESKGMTLTRITTRAPTTGTSGRGWRHGGRGAGRGHGQGQNTVTCF